MNNVSSSLKKDVIIIISIIIVFLVVLLVFYTEISKNRKISVAKRNYTFVLKELLNDIAKCKEKEQSLFFDISCKQRPVKKNISDYFNNNKKLKCDDVTDNDESDGHKKLNKEIKPEDFK